MKLIAQRRFDEAGGQALRYGLTGVALAGLYAAIYWGGATLIGMPAQLANGAGFAAALVAGYVLHSRWSFRGYGRRSNWSWGRFLVVNFAGFAMNCLWVWLIVDEFSYPVALSIVPIVTLTPVFTFLLNRGWTFS
jgi:putative flippase GtrA